MYLINTTFQVELPIADEFLDVLDYFISDNSKRGDLHSPILSRLSTHLSDETIDTETYALQFRVSSRAVLDHFQRFELNALLKRLFSRFGRRVMFFTSVLEIIK